MDESNDFRNIMELLNTSRQSNDITQALKKLQDEIAQLKKENDDLKSGKNNEDLQVNNRHSEVTDNVGKYASDEIDKILDENGVKAMAICISKSIMFAGSGTAVSSSCIESFDDISEEGIAAAAEVFTNPRRIAILKVLIAETLTATEITLRTGLVGGQLYHHLANLENAGLVIKENEKYKADGSAHGLLIRLHAVLGGMKLARE
jgi:DNA-binding transcriptional ArsR family regulator